MTLGSLSVPEFFFWNCLEATVLLAATLACVRFARHTSAATRHSICLSGPVAVCCLPILTVIMPAWSVSTTTANFVFWVSSLSRSTEPSHPARLPWSAIIALAWGVGTVCVLSRLAVGWYLLRRVRLASVPVRAELWREALPASFPLRSGPVTTALGCGVLRPCILLPGEADSWTAFDRRAILLHEAAHISRHDCLWNYIAQLACALFWFHPLAWTVARQLRREQELACDDLVLQRGVIPADYAELVLRSARDLSSASLLGCAFAARDLHHRLTHLLDGRRNRSASTRATAMYALSLLLVLVLVSAARPVAAGSAYTAASGISAHFSLQKAEPRSTGSARVYKIGGDVSAPVLLEKTEPEYTANAKNKKVQGSVLLSIVIGTDGRARDIQVVRGLDPGLDANAKKSVAAWRFKPSERQGKPVDVHAHVEVNFRLK